ncbi:MAG: hypothetical protein V3U73_10915 [bacterium]
MKHYNYSRYVELESSVDDLVSEQYRLRFEQGDKEAIFTFCELSWKAFRYEWVIDQIEKWQEQDTNVSRSKLTRLKECYSHLPQDSRGKQKIEEAVAYIERDQAVFKALVEEIIFNAKKREREFLELTEEELIDQGFQDFQENHGKDFQLGTWSSENIWKIYGFWAKQFFRKEIGPDRRKWDDFFKYMELTLEKVRNASIE